MAPVEINTAQTTSDEQRSGVRSETGRRRTGAWSATEREQTMPLPGDDLVPSPLVQTTHSVTINAPPAQVWPWLVRLGHGRAGFYADSTLWDRSVDWYYRRLSRGQPSKAPVGYRVEAADRIVPAWQHPRVGDIIADGPPGTAYYAVRHVEPNKAFVLFTDTHLRYLLPARLRDDPRLGIYGQLSDSYLLTEPEPGKTRMVRRMRLRCGPWRLRAYLVPVVLIWGEAITARHFLRGVKRRAEALAGAEQPLPRMERIKTRIEHQVDTRSARLGAGLLRLTKGRIARLWRRQVLILTTCGRRSGLERTVPLQYFPDGENLIVVAANSGLPSPPGWYFNLTADPRAQVEIEGRTLAVHAEELSAEAAAAFWPRVLQLAPDYARYPRRTSRPIPLIRLVPATPATASDTSDRPARRGAGQNNGER
jgi:deazaflavin-dependent oxidoreductase (nitroreductase family)